MNILVTGGAGFIGSHIVNTYIEAGHSVTIIDDLSTGEMQLVNPEATFYKLDIHSPEVKNVLEKEKISAINHHAAQISVTESVADPLFDANSNIIGTLQLLQNAVSLGIEKFIFASTGGAMYGEQKSFPASEDHPCQPLSPYAISKLCAENYINYFGTEHGLNTTVLRYSNVYGPHQNPHGEAGVVAIFCQRLMKGLPPVIFGDGEQTRDFISVRDVAKANTIALDPECKGVFNVGTGKETSVNFLTKGLIKVSGIDAKTEYNPARNGEQRRSSINSRKFLERFGWEPCVSLEEGLVETFDYFKNKTS
ncbi:MAG: NAD-dependent epimerase/dehydratase family protein [Nitrospinae bacterium]|nr:NAD-dependent epimerase/dehydratase family protein [Nitrospinota bacterium]MZH03822.1 NAD-dependent epimerase/dehydratase family protein [Nitrospinota bacterium]MZH15008.1 NAD-dependent epimerase/dehydratase family protein [Nitrospinota bacterium]